MNSIMTALQTFTDLPTLAKQLRSELERKKLILLYAYNGTGKTRLSMAFKDIDDVDVRTINYHLKKIFSDSELDADSVIRNFRITAVDSLPLTTGRLEAVIPSPHLQTVTFR